MTAGPGRLVERVRRKRAWMRRQRHGLDQYPSRYLNWMGFANAGMLHAGHRFLIDTAVSQLPTDDPVLEIGAFCGLSTNVLVYFLTKHGRPNALFSTDPWVFEGEGSEALPEPQIAFDDYRRFVREQFERNVRFWSGSRLPHAYALTSDEFFAAWREGGVRTDVFGPAQLRELLADAGFTDVALVGKRLGPIGSLASTPRGLALALDRLADRYQSLADTLIAYGRRPAS